MSGEVPKDATVTLDDAVDTIVAVGHHMSHYALIHIKLSEMKPEVIVYDGFHGNVLKWRVHVQYILSKCGKNPSPYMTNMRSNTTNDFGGTDLIQTDSYNCGPIACMVLWQLFLPQEVDVQAVVTTFRGKIVGKMRELLQEAVDCGHLLVCGREPRRG